MTIALTSPDPDDSLSEISQKVLQGLFQKHRVPLNYFAVKIVKRFHVAEEIVAESFVKLWRSKQPLRTPKEMRNFLYVVTKNACLDYKETMKKSPVKVLREEVIDLDQYYVDEFEEQVPYLSAAAHTALHKAVSGLPEKSKMVIELMLQGKTTAEIAEALGTNANNVKSLKVHAIKLLSRDIRLTPIILWLIGLYYFFFGGGD